MAIIKKNVMKKVVKGAGLKKVTKEVVKKVGKAIVLKKPAITKKIKDKEGFVTVNGKTFKIPKGWDYEKCVKVNHLELPVKGLTSVWLPLTQVQQYYQEAPEVYTEDSVGLRLKAYCRYDNCDLDWTQNLESPCLKILIQPLPF